MEFNPSDSGSEVIDVVILSSPRIWFGNDIVKSSGTIKKIHFCKKNISKFNSIYLIQFNHEY